MKTKISNRLKKAKIILAENFYSGSHFVCDVAQDAFKTAKNKLEVSEGLFMEKNTGMLAYSIMEQRRVLTRAKRRRITKFFNDIKEELQKIHNLGFNEAGAAYEQEINN